MKNNYISVLITAVDYSTWSRSWLGAAGREGKRAGKGIKNTSGIRRCWKWEGRTSWDGLTAGVSPVQLLAPTSVTLQRSPKRSTAEVLQPSLCSPQRYVDGGFTGLQPVSSLEEPVITVSPFTGELDICPRDCPAIFFCFQIFNGSIQISIENLCRISYALFPPSTMVSPPGFLPA